MKNVSREKPLRDYNFKYHLVGRIWTTLGILIFLSVPIAIGLYYGVTPDWKVFGASAVIIPLIINFISGIVEPIIYAPMLGTNSEYLAFITGNLSNLKIPCVVKAQEICGTKVGTEENEIVSTLAVATSTLVTVVIIAVVVLCLGVSNLQSAISKNSWIMPAFSCVVYALFGSLGGKYVAKNPKLALIPALIVVALSVILGVTGLGKGIGSAYLFVGIAVCALFAIAKFGVERKKQKAKEESDRLSSIANSHELIADEAAASSDETAAGSDAQAEASSEASEQADETDGKQTSETADEQTSEAEDGQAASEAQESAPKTRGDDKEE